VTGDGERRHVQEGLDLFLGGVHGDRSVVVIEVDVGEAVE
jgi:hypothetical protein